jgi:mono/diheme cytochrome c family protein
MWKSKLGSCAWSLLALGIFVPSLVAAPADMAAPPSFTTPTLVFDAEVKEYDAKPLELTAPFEFNITNDWTNEIVIRSVHTSCGCTTASLPASPWHLPPGSHGQVHASVNLKNKAGIIEKAITFDTSVGERLATLRVVIPPPLEILPASMSEEQRKNALILASADSRAIFHGECAACHVKPAEHKKGADLYAAVCGVCHDSPHRGSMVPDLHALKNPGDYEYWKAIIRFGKPHTMMPGFAQSAGGPLNEGQIGSLASYLNRMITHGARPRTAPLPPSAANSPPPNRICVLTGWHP